MAGVPTIVEFAVVVAVVRQRTPWPWVPKTADVKVVPILALRIRVTPPLAVIEYHAGHGVIGVCPTLCTGLLMEKSQAEHDDTQAHHLVTTV